VDEDLNRLTEAIIGAAIMVHRELGPGLLESSYQACLAYELASQGFTVQSELKLPVRYKGLQIDAGYRIDLLVDNKVIVEAKAVETMHPICEAQLLTYLKLSGCRVGLLINFNVKLLKDGITRRILG
jgi:GxxExxY protein